MLVLSAAEFVERVRVALGAANANRLSDILGLGAAGGQRVARWLRGDNEPDYEAMMIMLAKTGWAKIPGANDVAIALQPGSPTNMALEILQRVENGDPVRRAELQQVADAVRLMIAELEELAERLEAVRESRRLGNGTQ